MLSFRYLFLSLLFSSHQFHFIIEIQRKFNPLRRHFSSVLNFSHFSSYQFSRRQIRRDEGKQFFTIFPFLFPSFVFLFLSIVPQTNSRKTIFYNISPSFSIFIISLLTNFSLSANTRKTIVPSLLLLLPPLLFPFFILFISLFFPLQAWFLKTRFTNSMKGEINPSSEGGTIDGQSLRGAEFER